MRFITRECSAGKLPPEPCLPVDLLVDLTERIRTFLDGGPFAVVGASRDRDKYGNKCLRCYLQAGREVYPIHPSAEEIEGLAAFRDLASVPVALHAASIVTPPTVTERIVEEAAAAGVRHLWMQPGAEGDRALARAEELGIATIAGGPCLLVTLGYRE